MAIFDKLFRGKSRRKGAPGETPAPAAPMSGGVAQPPSAGPPAAAPTAVPGSAAQERSPEELCGLEPGMGKEEIRALLAKLFRRHNRLASSLDGDARLEADHMLDVIVQMREKYLS